jgi:chromate reductase, NAD(P)H dehydrogenase (quinone)
MAQANTQKPIRVLGIAGSLRRKSYNRATLRAAQELAPDDMRLENFDLSEIPLYNSDLETEGPPAPVQEFRDRLAAADAVLIVTPEYNYSIPGVLKNAIDWASRGPDSPLVDKPVAIMGASRGGFGTVLAQHQFRQMCVHNNMHPLNRPQVFISRAPEKFDEEGRLIDERTGLQIRSLLEALVVWARRLQSDERV